MDNTVPCNFRVNPIEDKLEDALGRLAARTGLDVPSEMQPKRPAPPRVLHHSNVLYTSKMVLITYSMISILALKYSTVE